MLDSEPLQTTYLYFKDFENKEILSCSYIFYESRGYVKYILYADGTLNTYRGVKHGFLSKEKDPYTWMEYQTNGRYMRYNDYLLISESDKNDASKHNDILYVISGNALRREAYVCEKDKKEIMEFSEKAGNCIPLQNSSKHTESTPEPIYPLRCFLYVSI